MSEDYYGLPTQSLGNEHVRLDYLAEAGPRIVRLIVGDRPNLLAEVPDFKLDSPYGPYSIQGGHRLWHAPEQSARTYIPDDDPVEITRLDNSVVLTAAPDPHSHIGKTIAIHVHPDKAEITLQHQLYNGGLWPVELAPWAITQMRTGSIGILPQLQQTVDPEGLLPNRSLSLWQYTQINDPRLHLGDDYIVVDGLGNDNAFKIGQFNPFGWIGCLTDDVAMIKKFAVSHGEPHPDQNCNSEIYCNDAFLEVETLGPLVTLQPEATVTHSETWTIHTNVERPADLRDLGAVLAALV